jgi:MinD superfamily P-loop ATPase
MICPVKAISMKENVAGKLTLYNDKNIFSTAELKMGNGTSGKLVSEVKSQMYEVAKNVEFAIIDGSPGIGCPVIASLSGVDLVLIVTEPSISGITDMKRIITTAQKFGVEVVVCINKYDINLENSKEIETYCSQNNLIFAGKVPYDINVVKAINSAENIINFNCPASSAIKEVYKNVIKLLLKER